jgi:hypothetical protein
MTVIAIVLFIACFCDAIVDQARLMKRARPMMAPPQRHARAPDVDMRALLEEAGRLTPRDPRVPTPRRDLPVVIPPYESAHPLWDRDLDQRLV